MSTDNEFVTEARTLLESLYNGTRFDWTDPQKIAKLVELYRKSGLTEEEFEQATDLRPRLIRRFSEGRGSTGRPWTGLENLLPTTFAEEMDKDWKNWPRIGNIRREIAALKRDYERVRWTAHPDLVRSIMDYWEALPEGSFFEEYCKFLGAQASSIRRAMKTLGQAKKQAKKKKETQKGAREQAKKKRKTEGRPSEKLVTPKKEPPELLGLDVLSSKPGSAILFGSLDNELSVVCLLVTPRHPQYRDLLKDHIEGK